MIFLVEVNKNSKKDGKATKGQKSNKGTENKQQEGEKTTRRRKNNKKGRKNHRVQSEAENG